MNDRSPLFRDLIGAVFLLAEVGAIVWLILGM